MRRTKLPLATLLLATLCAMAIPAVPAGASILIGSATDNFTGSWPYQAPAPTSFDVVLIYDTQDWNTGTVVVGTIPMPELSEFFYWEGTFSLLPGDPGFAELASALSDAYDRPFHPMLYFAGGGGTMQNWESYYTGGPGFFEGYGIERIDVSGRLTVERPSPEWGLDNVFFWNQVDVYGTPEPATLSLLVLGGLMVLRRRRTLRGIS